MDSIPTTVTAIVDLAPQAGSFTYVVSILRDAVLTAAAIMGAWVAWRGLHTWREQLTGQTEYDLAKRLLRDLYRYRDAVAAVRNPFMSVGEMADDIPLDDDPVPTPEWHHAGTTRAYQRRWEQLAAVRADLYPELLEAEVVWGDEINALFEPLRALENELYFAIEDQLEVSKPGVHPGEIEHLTTIEESRRRRRILYSRKDRPEDEFGAKFQSALDKFADKLRPHLQRHA